MKQITNCIFILLVLFLQECKDAEQHVGSLDELYLDIVSPPLQVYQDNCSSLDSQNLPIIEPNGYAFPCASLEILRSCTVNRKRLLGLGEEKASKLSINQIIKLSASNFIHSRSRTGDELYAISHPYASKFLGLSEEDSRDVGLVQDLLLCAEKVSNHQYHSASNFLQECYRQSFCQMNKTQRLVYYFTAALSEKIELVSGRRMTEGAANNNPQDPTYPSSATTAFFEKLPFSQITQFAAIQSMVEHASDSRSFHVIDLELRCGVHQVILMQSLDSRIEHFKITAIAIDQSNLMIEEAGVRLRALATCLNINFSFHILRLEDVINRHLSISDYNEDEKVIVYGAHVLEKLVPKPKELDILMRVIERIRPCAMISIEAEANVNSPIFVNRFVESLLYCGAYFDSLEECLKNDVEERTFIESKILNPFVKNSVAAEGGERKHRIVGLKVWRSYFARFRMVEVEISKLALTHANLILNRFECRDSCKLALDGSSLIVSWKETPICSLSVRKFC